MTVRPPPAGRPFLLPRRKSSGGGFRRPAGRGKQEGPARVPPGPFFHQEVGPTMRHRFATGALTAALLVGSALAGEGLKSGPQEGSHDIPAFNPLHATGPNAGEKLCLV